MNDYTQIKEQLCESLRLTFENITFSEVKEVTAEEFRKSVFYTSFSRSFSSKMKISAEKMNAEVCIYVIPNLVEILYDNAYGGQIFDDKEKKMMDLNGELLNIFVGHFLLNSQDKTGLFKLSVPENSKGFKALPQESMILYFIVEDIYPLIVTVSK